jgi:hypothetical protein
MTPYSNDEIDKLLEDACNRNVLVYDADNSLCNLEQWIRLNMYGLYLQHTLCYILPDDILFNTGFRSDDWSSQWVHCKHLQYVPKSILLNSYSKYEGALRENDNRIIIGIGHKGTPLLASYKETEVHL